ncbi:MAG: T9SS type A sorting domain-containing protein [candidate division Zixibacteria bacterium]|nr:T9SS type A sorting domain-containing protein [candidate division Zixibacteria bacterium]
MKIKMLMLLVVVLMAFGFAQAADSVAVALYNVTDGVAVTNGDDLHTVNGGGTPILYRFEMSLENSFALGGISLGTVFSSDGALKINWEAQAGGWGAGGIDSGIAAVIVEAGVRLDPAKTGSFDLTGLLVAEQDVDSTAPDEVLLGGASLFNSMAIGAMEHTFSFYFTLENPTGADMSLVIDSAKVGPAGDWAYITAAGTNVPPGFSGTLTYNVLTPSAAGDDPVIANVFSLDQNYPNPFNPSTTINYSLARKSKVNISVYNILGQQINTLVNGEKDAGPHQIPWYGDDNNGDAVASGIYFYKMVTDDFVETFKMVLMR